MPIAGARSLDETQLLDTYHAERHPVAARVLHNTMAQTALNGPGERIDALRDTMSELLGMHTPDPDRRHDVGSRHPLRPRRGTPLLGRRMPDLDLQTPSGPTRLFALLHQTHGVLPKFGRQAWNFDITRWADRVSMFDVQYSGTWKLPVIGKVAAPQAVLVRPDGYIAWVGDGSTSG